VGMGQGLQCALIEHMCGPLARVFHGAGCGSLSIAFLERITSTRTRASHWKSCCRHLHIISLTPPPPHTHTHTHFVVLAFTGNAVVCFDKTMAEHQHALDEEQLTR
jgi:hypothetical protein